MRLIITGGGTGGHVQPALAVLAELRQRAAVADVLWIGSADGVEGGVAERAGIPFRAVHTGKLRRYASAQTPLDAARIPLGVVQARRLLRSFHPDVVFSTGSFVSVPTVLASFRLAPVLTHEQTASLGLATRINARVSTVLAVSYEETAAVAGRYRHVTVTGNPVRDVLARGDAERGRRALGFTRELPILYVTGGARGASPLNQRIATLLPDLLDHCQILHQTGPASANADAEALAQARAGWPPHLQARYRVVEFVGDELPDVFAAADLVLGRAGAGTVAELAYLGKAAVLIPLPGAGGDEQTRNARLLANVDAAVLLPQDQATPECLRATLLQLLTDREARAAKGARAKAVGRPDAAARLADELLALRRQNNSR